MRPWRRWRTVAASVGLTLLVLEVGLRLSTLVPGSTPYFVADAELGLRVRPGVALGDEATNSHGFNDREWGPAVAGRARVAVIGDSFVFGVVPRRATLPTRLGERLREAEVLNLGIPAAGPATYVGLVRGEAAELGADVACVVFFVGNDVEQLHPDFRTTLWLGAPRQVLRRPYQLRLSGDYLYLFRLARAAVRLGRERGDGGGAGTFSTATFLAVEHQRMAVARRRPSRAVAAAYGAVDAWVADLRDAARRSGAELLVVLAPDQFQVDAELRRAVAARYEVDLRDYDLERPQRVLGETLAAAGVASLDLLPVFASGGGGELYLPADSHWNPAGNRLAAAAIARALRSRRWLEPTAGAEGIARLSLAPTPKRPS